MLDTIVRVKLNAKSDYAANLRWVVALMFGIFQHFPHCVLAADCD